MSIFDTLPTKFLLASRGCYVGVFFFRALQEDCFISLEFMSSESFLVQLKDIAGALRQKAAGAKAFKLSV